MSSQGQICKREWKQLGGAHHSETLCGNVPKTIVAFISTCRGLWVYSSGTRVIRKTRSRCFLPHKGQMQENQGGRSCEVTGPGERPWQGWRKATEQVAGCQAIRNLALVTRPGEEGADRMGRKYLHLGKNCAQKRMTPPLLHSLSQGLATPSALPESSQAVHPSARPGS